MAVYLSLVVYLPPVRRWTRVTDDAQDKGDGRWTRYAPLAAASSRLERLGRTCSPSLSGGVEGCALPLSLSLARYQRKCVHISFSPPSGDSEWLAKGRRAWRPSACPNRALLDQRRGCVNSVYSVDYITGIYQARCRTDVCRAARSHAAALLRRGPCQPPQLGPARPAPLAGEGSASDPLWPPVTLLAPASLGPQRPPSARVARVVARVVRQWTWSQTIKSRVLTGRSGWYKAAVLNAHVWYKAAVTETHVWCNAAVTETHVWCTAAVTETHADDALAAAKRRDPLSIYLFRMRLLSPSLSLSLLLPYPPPPLSLFRISDPKSNQECVRKRPAFRGAAPPYRHQSPSKPLPDIQAS